MQKGVYFKTASSSIIDMKKNLVVFLPDLLFFIFTGIGIFLFGIFAVAWAIGVMIVFPLLFPIIIPVLLVMLIIGFIARRR